MDCFSATFYAQLQHLKSCTPNMKMSVRFAFTVVRQIGLVLVKKKYEAPISTELLAIIFKPFLSVAFHIDYDF